MVESTGFSDLVLVLLIIAALVRPLINSLSNELSEAQAPDFYKRYGVIVKTLNALDEMAEVVGRYMDRDIYRFVTFKGHRYEFACIAPSAWKRHIGKNLLFLEPGIVYVALE